MVVGVECEENRRSKGKENTARHVSTTNTAGILRCHPQYYIVFMIKTDFIMILL